MRFRKITVSTVCRQFFYSERAQNKGKCSLNSIAEGKTISSWWMKCQEYVLTNSRPLKYKIALIYIFQRQHICAVSYY